MAMAVNEHANSQTRAARGIGNGFVRRKDRLPRVQMQRARPQERTVQAFQKRCPAIQSSAACHGARPNAIGQRLDQKLPETIRALVDARKLVRERERSPHVRRRRAADKPVRFFRQRKAIVFRQSERRAGGSSSALSKALAACGFISSAVSTMATRHPPAPDVMPKKPASFRISSTPRTVIGFPVLGLMPR
jgi:plasmid stabilization system protein ParE